LSFQIPFPQELIELTTQVYKRLHAQIKVTKLPISKGQRKEMANTNTQTEAIRNSNDKILITSRDFLNLIASISINSQFFFKMFAKTKSDYRNHATA
jgi:hypothetical protein